MAVVSFDWIGEGRTGGGDSYDGEITRTRVARVRTSTPADGEEVVLAACDSNGAALGDAHPDTAAAYCQRRTADNMSATKVFWIVTCHYSNKLIDNPLDEDAKIKVSGQLFTAPIMFDANGDLITNSANQQLVDPAPEADFPRRLITVRKNVAEPPGGIFDLQNTLNEDAFTIWPSYGSGLVVGALKAKLREPEIEGPETRNGVEYFVLSLTIDWRSEGWDDPLLDAGYADIDGKKLFAGGGVDKTEPSQPIPLNGSGLKLASPGPTTFFTITPVRYLAADWTDIVALI